MLQITRAIVDAPLSVMRVHPNQHHLFATGGKDRLLAIWDIHRTEQGRPTAVYQAKNVGDMQACMMCRLIVCINTIQ
jgi:hypothetical protein